jgi:hypothetical protein
VGDGDSLLAPRDQAMVGQVIKPVVVFGERS